jgi:hypothetical protein
LLDGFFDVFGARHIGNIASARRREKAWECRQNTWSRPARSPGAARR